MQPGQAFVLGIVQGLTEFLPISSTGHLTIFQLWLGLEEPQLFFDTFLHFWTLLAVLFFFRSQLLRMKWHDWWLLGLATLPVVLATLTIKDLLTTTWRSTTAIGWQLIITGFINWLADRKMNKEITQSGFLLNLINRLMLGLRKKLPSWLIWQPGELLVSWWQAILVGTAQIAAMFPAISRSGSTLTAGVWLGLKREDAFNFAFLMSVPAILGATLLQAYEVWQSDAALPTTSVLIGGAIAAFTTGLFSLWLLRWVIKKANLQWFAYYCWVLGFVLIFLV